MCLNLPSLKSSVLLEALAIIKEIGNNKEGEAAAAYANLGSVSTSDGEYFEAEEYHKKALEINKETGKIEREFQSHLYLTYCSVRSERRLYTIVPNLLESIQNSGEMYSRLGSNSMINVRYPFLRSTLLITPHWMLSHLSVVLLGIRMKLYTLPNSDDPNLWQT